MPDTEVVQLAFQLSEKRLESQQSAALAADTRAMSFAATVLAAAAILGGLSENAVSPTAMLCGAIILVVAAGIAGFSARPRPFYFPGARASDLSEDIEKEISISAVLTELGAHNDENSKKNDQTLKANSSLMKIAFVVSILGLILSLAPQIAEGIKNTDSTNEVAQLTS